MSDYMPAAITIGGPLPLSLRASLAGIIAEQGVGLEYGEGPLLQEEVLTLIDEAIRLGETLRLCDDEAANGEFQTLEAFLRSHGVAYKRTSDAKYEADGQAILFDGAKIIAHKANQRGKVTAAYRDIEQAIAEGRFEALLAELRLVEEGLPPLTDAPSPAASDVGAQAILLAA
ncbi:hypothetical protein FZ983_24205 [Azospirillum sp. B21]|uniref:hypothetical protein n=1 Tax=unclassified Azospirillum TaxID=2630922 RepID=UPI0011ED99AB|nr:MULTISPECIES: hypothetical protein [unclassified Azospirillum]KAA0576161.1 hypothetical protein FZ983_24205 [Azospirillum sp. B21]MDR6774729.1 hypothetical protein [Azospirillum sp. BE72]